MNENENREMLMNIELYYSRKIDDYGPTPQGVDWNGAEGQLLRFSQLCKVLSGDKHFSLYDLGCGYGALYDYLLDKYQDFSYHGFDISESMIKAAKAKHERHNTAAFSVASKPGGSADYSIASGIFNVKLSHDYEEWWDYMCLTLNLLDRVSNLGFSFNCLTSYSDEDRKKPYLYYADPCKVFDWCKKNYSRNVSLFHDYDLYEFTILVKK